MRSIAEEKYREQARRTARKAIREGDLIRPARCQRCAQIKSRIEAHHPNYDKPLNVEWLCRRCHAGEHRESYARHKTHRPPDEFNSAEAAAYLGYTLRSFYKRSHDIPHRKFRNHLFFKIKDLDAFNESRSTTHVPEPAS